MKRKPRRLSMGKPRPRGTDLHNPNTVRNRACVGFCPTEARQPRGVPLFTLQCSSLEHECSNISFPPNKTRRSKVKACLFLLLGAGKLFNSVNSPPFNATLIKFTLSGGSFYVPPMNADFCRFFTPPPHLRKRALLAFKKSLLPHPESSPHSSSTIYMLSFHSSFQLVFNSPFRLLSCYKLCRDGLLALTTHQIRLSKQHLSKSPTHPVS